KRNRSETSSSRAALAPHVLLVPLTFSQTRGGRSERTDRLVSSVWRPYDIIDQFFSSLSPSSCLSLSPCFSRSLCFPWPLCSPSFRCSPLLPLSPCSFFFLPCLSLCPSPLGASFDGAGAVAGAVA